MTAAEAREISFANNDRINDVLDEVKNCAYNGKTQTNWMESDVHVVNLLKSLGYSIRKFEGFDKFEIIVSW